MLDSAGIFAPIFFIIVQAVHVIIPILPGAVGCAFGVAFFGAVKGFLYNYIGICIGSICAFLIARAYGQNFVKSITSKRFFQKYNREMASWISTSFSGSRLAVASSSKVIGAYFKRVRAMEIRWRSPPDKVLPFSPNIVWYPSGNFWTNSSQQATFAAAITSCLLYTSPSPRD